MTGLYEQQDDDQKDFNLRGVFHTDAEGKYSFYCLRPTPYPVPQDGPAGKLLAMMDRNVFRPAHIHLMVRSLDNDSRRLTSNLILAIGPTRGPQVPYYPDL